MIKFINYTLAKGKRLTTATGLKVYSTFSPAGNQVIALNPVNINGVASQCEIQIPFEQTAQVCAEMLQFTIEHGTNAVTIYEVEGHMSLLDINKCMFRLTNSLKAKIAALMEVNRVFDIETRIAFYEGVFYHSELSLEKTPDVLSELQDNTSGEWGEPGTTYQATHIEISSDSVRIVADMDSGDKYVTNYIKIEDL